MADLFKSTFGTRVTDTATAILTAGSNKLDLKQVRLTNTSANDVNIQIWVAPSGTTVADGDQYEIKFTIPLNDTVYIPLNDQLASSGDFIALKASTTNVVNAIISYIEEA